jgi:mRNA (guanine-N7-)-methyltransferase
MIRTGAEEPTLGEITAVSEVEKERAAITQRYADRTASDKDMGRIGPLRDFHNKYIKETILYNAVMKKPGQGLIDIGMGVAQDIQKWRRVKAGAVLGIDVAGDSINNPNHGAYQRLWSTMVRNGRDAVLPMAFVIGDASKNMATGEAAATSEDKAILQSVLGKMRPTDVVPPYVQNELANRFKMGADIMSCMFATHYFFEAKEKFDGFLKNIAENLKVGGYFIGCCFDGEKTFEFLRGRESRQGIESETLLWTITKKYDADEIPAGDEAFGMPIDVEFISIGLPHREYLVPFKLLHEKMRSIGCDLCNAEELKELGLQSSTELFGESHKRAAKAGRRFPMTPAVEQFSFLSRWFVFRRRGEMNVEVPKVSVPVTSRVVTAPGGEGSSEEAVAAEVQAQQQAQEQASAAATTGLGANGKKQYAPAEVLQFYQEAAAQDRLKIGDKTALRWISPGTPFSIYDPATPSETYPSIEHFLAAMRYKVATDKPGLAQALFGQHGTIHQKFLTQRSAEIGVGAGAKPLSDDRDAKLLVDEMKEIHDEMRGVAMKKWKAKFDESKWSSVKDDLLKEAVRQRWEKDARFRTILEAAKQQGKFLLFYTGSASSEYGGKRTQEGYLEGENKLGKAIMTAAGFEV